MVTLALTSDAFIRVAVFTSVLAVMALLEVAIPKRALGRVRGRRWLTNLSIVAAGVALVRGLALMSSAVAVPLVAMAAAEWARANGWGVFNLVEAPAVLEIAAAIVILDFAIWLQHLVSHKVPLLWRLHQVHHADLDFDVTTALRFHPVEIGLSMLYKVGWVLLLGPATIAVFIFEVVLNACAMFNHSNVDLPASVDRVLRKVIVTPDMHRVHHSTLRREHNSNYGFNLSIWDRLLGTYTDQPVMGHQGMSIGLDEYRSESPTRFLWSLGLPFSRRRIVAGGARSAGEKI